MSFDSDVLLEHVRAETEGEYSIERELGRGGMAAVFLARDLSLGRSVAIKVMLPHLVDVEGIADRFVIEARTAARLDHPGIVTVYSVTRRAGLLCIVMKYLDGRTLDDILKSKPARNPAVVTAILKHVGEALEFAHAEGVVHRDVKPSNIIIDARGRPVVVDFGIAKVLSARSITTTGSMLGTPTYMSPEQCRGLPATAASDQYALGVLAYEMLAGHVPFTGTLFELIEAHSSVPPQPLDELVPGIDGELSTTVMRMLEKDPADRWPSLGAVVQRLAAHSGRPARESDTLATIAAFAFTAATPDAVLERPLPSVVQAPNHPSGRRSRGALFGAGAVLLAGVVLWLATRHRTSAADGGRATSAAVTKSVDEKRNSTPDSAAPARASAQAPGSPSAPQEGVTAVTKDSAQGRPSGSRSAEIVPDSIRANCARLLERLSLGDKLTVAEATRFKSECSK